MATTARLSRADELECTTSDLAAYYRFLDDLRVSGVTNMYGAGPYLEEEFHELDKDQAGHILVAWMKDFSA